MITQSALHTMLDLETLGNGHDAVIVSIGACKFDPTGEGIVDSFHVAIDPADAQRHGLRIDASTVMWWLNADRAGAREALLSHEMIDLPSALVGFAGWMNEAGPVWGNGATFDNVILRNAYTATGQRCPWAFYQDRCYRTVKNLAPSIPLVREGTHHDALDDAVSQARHLQAIVRHIGVEVIT